MPVIQAADHDLYAAAAPVPACRIWPVLYGISELGCRVRCAWLPGHLEPASIIAAITEPLLRLRQVVEQAVVPV
jgi:hypothetical protein